MVARPPQGESTGGGGTDLTTKGDLHGYDTADTRIPIGTTDGHVLTVDSAEALGLKWAAQTGGSQTPWTTNIDGDGFNLTDAGVIFLREQADADADVAGQGQIWVNTATPNELYFTDDAGNDHAVASDQEKLSFFAATTSAELAGVISDETGSGALVFGTSPTITTPTIASFTNATHDHEDAAGGGNIAHTAISDFDAGVQTNRLDQMAVPTADLDINNVNLDSVNSMYLNEKAAANADIAGDGQVWVKTATPNELWFTDDAGSDFQVAFRENNLSVFAATTSAQLAGVISDETGSGALVFATSPTLVTPVLGTPTSGTLTNCTGLPIDTGLATGTKANLESVLSDVSDIAEADGDTYTGTHDFGGADDLEIPNSATPTVDTDGQIAIDTTVTDFSHGIMKYYSGEEMAVVAVPIAQLTSPTDNHVIAYNATNDEFELVAESGGGSVTLSNQSDTMSGDFTTSSTTYVGVTNLAVTLANRSGGKCFIGVTCQLRVDSSTADMNVRLDDDDVEVHPIRASPEDSSSIDAVSISHAMDLDGSVMDVESKTTTGTMEVRHRSDEQSHMEVLEIS